MKKIVLIDDKPEIQAQLVSALSTLVGKKYALESWDKDIVAQKWKENMDGTDSLSNADEDVWYRVLVRETGLALVVADHDLSAYGNVRISESAITDACRQSATPVCTYHRKPSAKSHTQALRGIYGQTRSFSIAIDLSDIAAAAATIVDIADSFETLQIAFPGINEEVKKQGPAAIIASILEQPGLTSVFSRYATGPTLASDVIDHIAIQQPDEESVSEALDKRMPFVLGCWLHNYVLPFPGVILNGVAAASYVNLLQADFDSNISEFQAAQYVGPFGKAKKYWWRSELDNLFIEHDCEDGIAYLAKKSKDAGPSVCSATQSSPAGYYCIVRRAPISLTASVGSLGWVPEGADLSRMDQAIYDSVAHMMGI